MYLKRFVYDRLLDWKNENKTIQFGNRHQSVEPVRLEKPT